MVQDRVLATYLIETPHSLEHAATVIAGEQSSGTFVAIPGETSELKERYGAQVVRIEPLDSTPTPSLPGSKPPRATGGGTEYRRGRIVVSFPLHSFGASLPSLLSTVAGNLHELQEVSGLRLEDLELPPAFAERHPGPGFGIDGTRKLAHVRRHCELPIHGHRATRSSALDLRPTRGCAGWPAWTICTWAASTASF